MKQETASEMRRRSGLLGFLGLSGANKLVLAESLVTLALVSLAIRLNSQSAAACACVAAVKMQRLSLRSACNQLAI